MITAVQLRDGRAHLLSGSPTRLVQGRLGPIALFPSGEIVAYHLVTRRRHLLTVFRTLAVDDPLAASVEGVFPRVHLLVAVQTAARVRAVREFLALLARTGNTPALVSDHLYARLSAVLAGRPPPICVLSNLLTSPSAETPWIPLPLPS